jgi:hypothetical protein
MGARRENRERAVAVAAEVSLIHRSMKTEPERVEERKRK